MPPKYHRVSGNDGVYELTTNILTCIRSIIAHLKDDLGVVGFSIIIIMIVYS
jgi:hypothetical protein